MNISGIRFADQADEAGDIEVIIEGRNEYLDEKYALDVIKHLSSVFGFVQIEVEADNYEVKK